MIFQQQDLGAEGLPRACVQKYLPSKPSNEWISPFQTVLSGFLFFSLSELVSHALVLSPGMWMCDYIIEKNYNLILLFDQLSLKSGGSRIWLWRRWPQQQKRLLSVILAESLIPTKANLYSNAFHCDGLLLSAPKQQTRCIFKHRRYSILHKIPEYYLS